MESHLAVLRRVGSVLLIFCALHSFAIVGDLFASQPHSFTIDLATGGLGVLLSRGSLGAARFAAFLNALTLACATGGALVVAVAVSLRLGPALPRPSSAHEWLLLVWAGGWWIADLALSLWTVRELRARQVEAALQRARRGSASQSAAWGAGLGIALAALALIVTLYGQRRDGLVPLQANVASTL